MSTSDRPKPPNVGPPQGGPDPDDPPSEEELRAAEALRRALEGSVGQGAERSLDREADRAGEFAQSLRAAASPREIAPDRHRQLIDRALSTPRAAVAAMPRARAERRRGLASEEQSLVHRVRRRGRPLGDGRRSCLGDPR
jgi:hypothetical protein